MATERHFTATAFVVHGDAVLLHWHPKVKAWLPPGGHIQPGEDPVQAVLREVWEETGLRAAVVPTVPLPDLSYPRQVAPPVTIMVEDIHDPVDGYHQHIDMIYFCRPEEAVEDLRDGWLWVDRAHLEAALPLELQGTPRVPPPEDVRLLALRAIEAVQSLSQRKP